MYITEALKHLADTKPLNENISNELKHIMKNWKPYTKAPSC